MVPPPDPVLRTRRLLSHVGPGRASGRFDGATIAFSIAFSRAALRELGSFDSAFGNGAPALGGVNSEMLLWTLVERHRFVCGPAALVHQPRRADYETLRRQIYGCWMGLTADRLKRMVTRLPLLPNFATKLLRGLAFALDPHSKTAERKRSDYPPELTRLEIEGTLSGSFASGQSLRALGGHPKLVKASMR